MTCFSSLARTEWEELLVARSRIEVREQELIDHQEWEWEDKISSSIPCWSVYELHAGRGIPKEP